MSDFTPKPEHHFTFGLWTVGNPGRDPFGDPVRPPISPNDIVEKLGELGAYGVNLHDNDLVPADASAAEKDRIVREFKTALTASGMRVRVAEDHAGHRSWCGVGSHHVRLLGRAGRSGNECRQGLARRAGLVP